MNTGRSKPMKGIGFRVLGLMSGSSLDGLDVALCQFRETGPDEWEGQIEAAKTVPFPETLFQDLQQAARSSALELCRTEQAFLEFCARSIREFPGWDTAQLIASHGHTLFHKPAEGWTLQIGNGARLQAMLGLPLVSDFRSADVALGGQGAPLVPGAERFLFSDFTACLNLGGIANISFPQDLNAPGFDVCACNQWLNGLAGKLGMAYDRDGLLSAEGLVIPDLLEKLNQLEYYQKNGARSLGNEDCQRDFDSVLDSDRWPVQDQLATVLHHIGFQIGRSLPLASEGKMLVTGGGAFHPGLIGTIRTQLPSGWSLEIPDPLLISFKEAYCFAFLGLRRALNRTNVFAKVTGARTDSVSGQLSGSWE